MGVAQHEGAAAQNVVNVLAAREVAQARPAGLPHDERQLLRGIVAAQDASGEHPHRRLEQSCFFGTAAGRTCHSTSLGCGDWTVLYRENALGRKGALTRPGEPRERPGGLGREAGRPEGQADPVPLVVGDRRERRPHVGGRDAAEDREGFLHPIVHVHEGRRVEHAARAASSRSLIARASSSRPACTAANRAAWRSAVTLPMPEMQPSAPSGSSPSATW